MQPSGSGRSVPGVDEERRIEEIEAAFVDGAHRLRLRLAHDGWEAVYAHADGPCGRTAYGRTRLEAAETALTAWRCELAVRTGGLAA